MTTKKTWSSPSLVYLDGGEKILTGTAYFPAPECNTATGAYVSIPAATATVNAAGLAACAGATTGTVGFTVSVPYVVTSCASVGCYASGNGAAAPNCPIGVTGTGPITITGFACS